jgi:hypothetical protein
MDNLIGKVRRAVQGRMTHIDVNQPILAIIFTLTCSWYNLGISNFFYPSYLSNFAAH